MTTIDFNALDEEYGYNAEDDDALYKIKEAVNTLSEADRRIIHLYADEGSMRKVAQHLKVSPATAFHYIHKIRNKITDILNYGTTEPIDTD